MPSAEVPSGGPHYLSIGCLLAVAGFFAGGMIAVAIGLVVTMATGCTPTQGFPICDIYRYWVPGMIVGAVTLPAIAIWRLRRRDPGPHTSRRS
jgi:hypothetical protein